jgi:hypothetical protein
MSKLLNTYQESPAIVGKFKITRQMLRTDLPSVRTDKEGGCNQVLACWKRTIYDNTNTYIGRWTTSNTEYYRKNVDQFEGWIELEDLISKFCPENVVEVDDEQIVES